MKAYEKKFLYFLEGHDKQFVIPVYQRNYDWKLEQCKQLFDDILSVHTNNYKNHFLGSIVSIYHEDGEGREYLIIDGQQRITTLSLLLLAIHNLLASGQLTAERVSKENILEEYLVNRHQQNTRRIRLKPIKKDNNSFSKLFENNPDEFEEESRLTRNYAYFVEKLLSMPCSLDDFYDAIKKLEIVEVELKRGEDDPQLIFESLNSTGLSLTQADLARNFVLMREKAARQEELYDKFWHKIEINTEFKVDDFLRHYLTFRESKIPKKDAVYANFKRFVQEKYGDDIEKILEELLTFSAYYRKIVSAKTEHDKINRYLHILNQLEVSVSYPYLLEIFDDFEKGILTAGQVIEILSILESFTFRRMICEVSTNALNKIFMVLGREVKKHSDYKDNYIDVLTFVLTSKKGSQRFPDDKDFSENLMKRDMYRLKGKNKLHLLESLENYDNKERVDVEGLLASNELNIEHIMPQTLTEHWRTELGDNYSQIHSEYLDTLGNLTLTGYNSKMSNKPFIEKRDMEKGFRNSRLSLNRSLHGLEHWNEDTIKNRAEELTELCLKIWKYPRTEFMPEKNEAYIYDLSDENEFTGLKIESFTFADKPYPANSWRDMYQQIARLLYDRDPQQFRALEYDDEMKIGKNKGLTTNRDELTSALEVTKGLYLECHLSARAIISMVKILLKKFDVDVDEISIYIKES